MLCNKVVSMAFARSLGVRTASLLHYGPISTLPEQWPKEWGRHIVVKPLNGHSSFGILLLVDGWDLLSRRHYRGRADVRGAYSNATGAKGFLRDGKLMVLVESMLLGLEGQAAADIKFYMFGEHIGGVHTVQNRAAPPRCLMWLDTQALEHGKVARTDLPDAAANGCVVNWPRVGTGSFTNISKKMHFYHKKGWLGCDHTGCTDRTKTGLVGNRACTDAEPPLRSLLEEEWVRRDLLATAKKIGKAIGAPARVDLFITTQGVAFGELSCLPQGLQFHCAVPYVANGTRDPCYMGKQYHKSAYARGEVLPRPPLFAGRIDPRKLALETGLLRGA